MGPTSTDPNCLTMLYYSSVNGTKEANTGLVGPLLVCRKGSLGEDGKQVSHGTCVQVCPGEGVPETEPQKKGTVAASVLRLGELVSPTSSLSSAPDLCVPLPNDHPLCHVPQTPLIPLTFNFSFPSGQPQPVPPAYKSFPGSVASVSKSPIPLPYSRAIISF